MLERLQPFFETFISPGLDVLLIILSYWWLYVPIIILIIGLRTWRLYKSEEYKSELEWDLMEIRIPREVEKTPKSMEQIFAAMHEMQSSIDWKDKWFEGKVKDWMSAELIGRAGSIHFMMRVPKDYRDLLESSIYAQYPEAEITLIPEEDDYVNELPDVLPNEKYDLWGTELVLSDEDAYPIRTYEFFEHKEEEKRIDPIANIMETMSGLERSEAVWIQILMRPADDGWIDEAEDVIAELMGEDPSDSADNPLDWFVGVLEGTVEFIGNFFVALFEEPSWKERGGGDSDSSGGRGQTPGERSVIEAIEKKVDKAGFEGAIRILYIDDREEFTKSNIASTMGSIKQFNSNKMNSFEANKKVMPSASGPFKNQKILHKKRKLYSDYKTRNFPKEYSVFNAEELATIYHFPLTGVKSPKLQKTEFRKGGPPTDLPMFE